MNRLSEAGALFLPKLYPSKWAASSLGLGRMAPAASIQPLSNSSKQGLTLDVACGTRYLCNTPRGEDLWREVDNIHIRDRKTTRWSIALSSSGPAEPSSQYRQAGGWQRYQDVRLSATAALAFDSAGGPANRVARHPSDESSRPTQFAWGLTIRPT